LASACSLSLAPPIPLARVGAISGDSRAGTANLEARCSWRPHAIHITCAGREGEGSVASGKDGSTYLSDCAVFRGRRERRHGRGCVQSDATCKLLDLALSPRRRERDTTRWGLARSLACWLPRVPRFGRLAESGAAMNMGAHAAVDKDRFSRCSWTRTASSAVVCRE
jgi:hypothetical protein